MEVATDHQQHASPWIRPDARVGSGLDAGGMIPETDMGSADMFFHSMDTNANHQINPASYYASPAAARAVHGYRPTHGKFTLLTTS